MVPKAARTNSRFWLRRMRRSRPRKARPKAVSLGPEGPHAGHGQPLQGLLRYPGCRQPLPPRLSVEDETVTERGISEGFDIVRLNEITTVEEGPRLAQPLEGEGASRGGAKVDRVVVGGGGLEGVGVR